MRITIVYRYFWPDTPPYAEMLKQISAWLVEEGHEVQILTAQPAYKPEANIPNQPVHEIMDGVSIIRLPLLKEGGVGWKKVINSLLFIAQAFIRILFGRKNDVVWTATMPPVLQALMVMIAGKLRGARFLYHMQDIHPEISITSNVMKSNVFTRLMISIDRFTQTRSTKIVVLSDDMRQSVIERGIPSGKVVLVRNFSLGESEGGIRAMAPRNGEVIKFVFAGNIGRFQNLNALVESFKEVSPADAELIFVGDGRAKKELIELVENQKIENISFMDHMTAGEVFGLICKCHVGVISLLPGLYRYAFPSKLLTYMAANLPVFALIEDHSALAKLLKGKQIGVSVSWDKPLSEVRTAILAAATLARAQKTEPRILKEYYHPDEARKSWLALMNSLEAQLAK
ncbi:MAG: glycosyltransferase family 4 protein [Rhizobiaceae bacterium]